MRRELGFALVELIVVVAILGILVAIAIPRLSGFSSLAEERVCVANRKAVERVYSGFLVENDLDHTELLFDQFLISRFDSVCPAGGTIYYSDSVVDCDVHGRGEIPEVTTEEETTGEVPWL